VFDAEQSDDLAGGREIERLADALKKDIHWARDLYGVLETRGQDPVERPLAALNTGFATDGDRDPCATGKAAKPISLIYLHRDETSDAILHHVVKVEPGAEVTVLENGPAAARFNKCMEIDVADGAAFHHVRAQGRDHERRAVTHMFARLGDGIDLQVLHADRQRRC
jgi:Fe-S cluster assembly protein SufD